MPLLRGGTLSKGAVPRLVRRLREYFERCRTRDLANEDIRDTFTDDWYLNVRIGGRRERVSVPVTLDVRARAERIALDLPFVREESSASWTEAAASWTARHLARRVLVVIDGDPDRINGLRSQWQGTEIQRCTAHYADLQIMPMSMTGPHQEASPPLRMSA